MNEINFSTSACRYCGFYKPEGRRGGSCQRLGVPVQGSWKACTYAAHPFETTLKKLEDIFQLPTSVELSANNHLAADLPIIKAQKTHPVEAVNEQKSASA